MHTQRLNRSVWLLTAGRRGARLQLENFNLSRCEELLSGEESRVARLAVIGLEGCPVSFVGNIGRNCAYQDREVGPARLLATFHLDRAKTHTADRQLDGAILVLQREPRGFVGRVDEGEKKDMPDSEGSATVRLTAGQAQWM